MQLYTSEKTSLNQVASVFKKFNWNGINLDLGGGKFDRAQGYLNAQGYKCLNLVFDPYNRTEKHNADVVALLAAHGGADTCTISNVLNVIAEESVQLSVICQASKSLKIGGQLRITVYEGDRSGVGKPSTKGYQQNKKLSAYLPLVKQVFPNAQIKQGVIVAEKV